MGRRGEARRDCTVCLKAPFGSNIGLLLPCSCRFLFLTRLMEAAESGTTSNSNPISSIGSLCLRAKFCGEAVGVSRRFVMMESFGWRKERNRGRGPTLWHPQPPSPLKPKNNVSVLFPTCSTAVVNEGVKKKPLIQKAGGWEVLAHVASMESLACRSCM